MEYHARPIEPGPGCPHNGGVPPRIAGTPETPARAMTSDELADFIEHRMRMSHVYQPVMLTCLLTNRGHVSVTDIARSILRHDESQVEYYESVTNNMVGRVLRRHAVVRKEGD